MRASDGGRLIVIYGGCVQTTLNDDGDFARRPYGVGRVAVLLQLQPLRDDELSLTVSWVDTSYPRVEDCPTYDVWRPLVEDLLQEMATTWPEMSKASNAREYDASQGIAALGGSSAQQDDGDSAGTTFPRNCVFCEDTVASVKRWAEKTAETGESKTVADLERVTWPDIAAEMFISESTLRYLRRQHKAQTTHTVPPPRQTPSSPEAHLSVSPGSSISSNISRIFGDSGGHL
jgi:hypothetical protein